MAATLCCLKREEAGEKVEEHVSVGGKKNVFRLRVLYSFIVKLKIVPFFSNK